MFFFFQENNEKLDIAGKLFPLDLPILIAHLIAGCFLLFCISFFLYKPYKKWSELRSQEKKAILGKMNQQLTEAENKNFLAGKNLSATEKVINKMMIEAKKEINQEKKTMLRETLQMKKEILTKADLQTEMIRKEAQEKIKKAIITNAIALTEKILKEKIDSQKHQEMFDDFIKKLDD